MNASYQEMLSIGRFDAITVTLFEADDSENHDQVWELFQASLAQFDAAPAVTYWSIERVGQQGITFDLVAPEENSVTAKLAFDMRNELLKQPVVSEAEVLFDIVAAVAPAADDAPESYEETDSDVAAFGLLTRKSWWDKLTAAEHDPNWNHAIVGTQQAWAKHKGEGIRIAHPDTGYIPHFELANGDVDMGSAYDFFDDDGDPTNVEGRGGNHGLGTSSVLIGDPGANQAPYLMHGVAPDATIVPYRIARDWAPVFVTWAGPRRVRQAVDKARESNCQVISMSLGGVFARSLHDAIKEAAAENIIICAAAGNYVGPVVWPALYEETIAVAACAADGEPWEHSSSGPKVDVTAPGHNVWRAEIDDDGLQVVRPGSGTSYATPHVAAAAALWLGAHGRENLLAKYAGIPLYKVFRAVLRQSCQPWADGRRNYGAGILNIPELLATPLPDPSTFDEEAGAFGAAGEDILSILYEMFTEVQPVTVEARLAQLLAVPVAELGARLALIHDDELLFRITTSAALRRYFAAPESDIVSFGAATEEVGPANGRTYLLDLDLSDDLKAQLAG